MIKKSNSEDDFLVCNETYIKFDKIETYRDSKNYIQALEVSYKDKKMAIKINLPKSICTKSVHKLGLESKHKNMATLVLDLYDDIDNIQTMNSNTFSEYLLSEKLYKYWIYNPRVKEKYPEIYKKSEKIHKENLICEESIIKDRNANPKFISMNNDSKFKKNNNRQEELALGYKQIKNKNFECDTNIITDRFNTRWVKCKICGKIKSYENFWTYGGQGEVNLGKCYECNHT